MSEIGKHEKLILNEARRFLGRGVELEDLLQEGRMAFLQAEKSWGGKNGAVLWTYAKVFVFKAMLTAVKKARKAPSRPMEEDFDYLEAQANDIVDTSDNLYPSPEDLLLAREARLKLRDLIAALAPEDREFLTEWMEAESYEELAMRVFDIVGEGEELEKKLHRCKMRVHRRAKDLLVRLREDIRGAA